MVETTQTSMLLDKELAYDRKRHAAAKTDAYVFNQLIPYIGNKRKLLDLIWEAVLSIQPERGCCIVDLFAGAGVVSRFLKRQGFRVIANDWEPFTVPVNTCYIQCNKTPVFSRLGGYDEAIKRLNSLPPIADWVTDHLCPRDDRNYDVKIDRMFYMRKNGMRIDAIRNQIQQWRQNNLIDAEEEACLLAPLLYQASYTSNTSGVFKGFHKGWGGQTATALYRIASDLRLSPALFFDNSLENVVMCADAQDVAESLNGDNVHLVYLDPPYNQHPYGSNYHVLNSISLWDKPPFPKTITRGTKSAIRLDWRTERRSAYNYQDEATRAYRKLLASLKCRYILTSYSTEGVIPLPNMLRANIEGGNVKVFMRGYKRYRVSSQRFSKKPLNIEFVLVLDTQSLCKVSMDELQSSIEEKEASVLSRHPEYVSARQHQLMLFEGRTVYGEESSTKTD